jgi:hypothetical protein
LAKAEVRTTSFIGRFWRISSTFSGGKEAKRFLPSVRGASAGCASDDGDEGGHRLPWMNESILRSEDVQAQDLLMRIFLCQLVKERLPDL